MSVNGMGAREAKGAPASHTEEDSKRLWRRAQDLLPGGVNSPVRSMSAVGMEPFFVRRGEGAFIETEDGRRLLDYVMSWGPLILGHAHSKVVEAVRRVAGSGTSFGMPSRLEVALAERITSALPSVEMVRMVNSGTEATMSAIRLARAATGRNVVVKFAGSYHGHVDALLVRAGSGMAAMGLPSSPGVPEEVTRGTAVLPYNDLDAARSFFAERGKDVAAVIVEPSAGNMGVVPPVPGFLQLLRSLTEEAGALLIFDEVITGFRLSYAGAQGLFGIRPDLTCLGKVIGGGLPVGAYGGRRDLMKLVAPSGDVYQAGTLSGNPLAMAAGAATLDVLAEGGFYEALESKVTRLTEGIREAARARGVGVTINQARTIFTVFMTSGPVTSFEEASRSDRDAYGRLFRGLLARGVFVPPAPFEAMFTSAAHDDRAIERTVDAYDGALRDASGARHS